MKDKRALKGNVAYKTRMVNKKMKYLVLASVLVSSKKEKAF